ncbi:CHAT domain-containing protein [Biscogniauxia sp. FL1348]|nr:CHAT domain-containing protein [Biscogniauxia sp. FL1348]
MSFEAVAAQYGISMEDLPDLLSTLAINKWEEYEETHDLQAINDAVRLSRAAVERTPPDDPDLAERQNELSIMLESQYERTGALSDLEEAIRISKQSVASTVSMDPIDHASRLNNLGNMLESLFEETGDLEHLKNARQMIRDALAQLPSADENLKLRASLLGNLGNKMSKQYSATGDAAALEEAVELSRKAVALTPESSMDRVSWMNSLGHVLSQRFSLRGNLSDIDEAIEIAREAIRLTRVGHREESHCESNLSGRLYQRYCFTASAQDLAESIRTARLSVSKIPSDHPERAYRLTNLGNALGKEFERTGELATLEEAIEVAREVVKATPEKNLNYLSRQNILSNRLESYFERTGSVPSLQEAVRVAKQVVHDAAESHSMSASFLASLSNKLERTVKLTEDVSEASSVLDEAIELTREAIKSASSSSPEYPSLLDNLARQLGFRYDITSNMSDLDEAVKAAKRATSAVGTNDLIRGVCFSSLGAALEERFRRTSDAADLESAVKAFYESWKAELAAPFNRIEAASRCIRLLDAQDKFDTAANLAKEAIDFLPTMYTAVLDRNDEQFAAATWDGLAAEACSILLAKGQVEEALQYLEWGRAIIIGKLLDNRADVSELQMAHPALAQRYQTLVAELNAPLREPTHDPAEVMLRNRRKELVGELDACIRDIRAAKGHERFLLGQTITEMQETALGGHIVVVNFTEFRNYAIIITASSIKAVNLPQLPDLLDMKNRSMKDLERHLRQFRMTSLGTLVGEDGPRNAKLKGAKPRTYEFSKFLERLWLGCVKTIVDELGLREQTHDKGLARIWWIGTGLAHSLPFHAAGIHSDGSAENTMSRAISSYTPSIRTLHQARGKARHLSAAQSVLLVTMPETPAHSSLPGVVVEAQAIHDAVQPPHSVRQLDRPSREQVLGALESCSVVHFACHGHADPSNPSHSCLVLQGPGAPEELTVRDMMDADLGRAWLAYLSACSTAENSARDLADEQLHLASGFHVAGFGHVVASLWPSSDAICAQAASVFYRRLMSSRGGGGGGGALGSDNNNNNNNDNNRAVAEALHEAVREIRAKHVEKPHLWAQYIHSGA